MSAAPGKPRITKKRPSPSVGAPAQNLVASLPAGLDVESLAAMGAAIASGMKRPRKLRRDIHRQPKKPQTQRGALVVALETPSSTRTWDFAVVLRTYGHRYDRRKTHLRCWIPENNDRVDLPIDGVRVLTAAELAGFAEAAESSTNHAVRMGALPGTVLEVCRPVSAIYGSGMTRVVLPHGPPDQVVVDPIESTGRQIDRPMAINFGGDRAEAWDADETEEWPPYEAAGLKTWHKHAAAVVWAYSLRHRVRVLFRADALQRHEFDVTALDRVVLPRGHKERILDVAHAAARGGRGASMLFWGSAGVGKTYTARMLAEHLQRPLLSIDGRDLAGGPAKFEGKIRSALQRAALWGAVVLFDEADVLLRERDMSVDGGAYTVALLRVLDQHGGIVVMTSNRAFRIDPAFESRIHLRLQFPPLSPSARGEVWRRELAMAGIAVDEGLIIQLAAADLDGREIRLAVENASSSASRHDLVLPNGETLLMHAKTLAMESGFLRMEGSKAVGFGRGVAKDEYEWE